jgi:hypothetical protein
VSGARQPNTTTRVFAIRTCAPGVYAMPRSSDVLEPERYGQQSDGSYLPGPNEIARRAAVIRKGWSRTTTQARTAWQDQGRYSIPEISESEIGGRC